MDRKDWAADFLEALAASPNVTAACLAAGVERSTAYRRRGADADFAAAWDDAQAQSTDALVGEMYRRAVHGTEKPVFHQGGVCGHVREFSDTLAIFLAKAHRPEVYRETVKQEVSGVNGGPVEVVSFYIPHNGRDTADSSEKEANNGSS